MKDLILQQCQQLFPAWRSLGLDDFRMDDPKGFSSFTMRIQSKAPVTPSGVFYRRLEGKENAILNFEAEKEVYLLLAENEIAARCHHYDKNCRIESFYKGRTLIAEDLFDQHTLKKIAFELHKFHQLRPPGLPRKSFFDLIFKKWGDLARNVLENQGNNFPSEEQRLLPELRQLYSPETLRKVKQVLPPGPLNFCHNDTYHGNIMKLDSGKIKLLDFEFSCLNNKAYDFSNLFAETVMKHQQEAYPYFKIAEPAFGEKELSYLINAYLDHSQFANPFAREKEFETLMHNVKRCLILSDYKYALASLPLAVNPIQKIRFIPYAHQRFTKFLDAYSKLDI